MITVHMTTFKRLQSNLLRRAIENVLAQTYLDFEFIICDDASTDGSAEYLRAVAASDARVKIIRNPRNVNNVAISFGRCFKQADQGRPYVTWMFDDCTLEPNAFEILIERLERSNAEFVFGMTRVHNADGSILVVGGKSESEIRSGVVTSSILVPNGAILVRRSVFERIGWFDPNIVLRRSCDWDLFRRIIGAGCSFQPIDKVLMDEYGELQNDSLRNSFMTTMDIMLKFTRLRDTIGLDVSLDAALNTPIDLIPTGDWQTEELSFVYAMFVEYYLSIGDVARAYVWAEKLEPSLQHKSLLLENLAASVKNGDHPQQGQMAAGALAAGIYWSYKEGLTRASG